MSADNCIGIRQLPNGKYAVRELGYSDISYAENQGDNALDLRFTGDHDVFNTECEAEERALEILDGLYICEYGIMDFPRKKPVDGPVGNYKVVVAKVIQMEYHLSDVTPEAAAEKAFEMANEGREPDAPQTESCFRVASVKSS